MKTGWIPLTLAIALCASCGERERAKAAAKPESPSASEKKASVDPSAGAEAEPSGETVLNERTRAAPREEKVYPKPPAPSYPVAKPVEGSPGMVVSPYSGQTIDVTGFASGALVRDPAAPAKENSIFRIP